MKQTHIERRNFLKTSAAAAAAISLPTIIPSSVFGGPDKAGANEMVNVGVIGCGGRARGVYKECPDVKAFRVAAVCDCMFPRAEQYAKLLSGGAKWGLYRDFRKMIDKENLDGVMIETTTHARAWIAILAMRAGMDVYIEKPMCLTIAEGRAMGDAARKFNRVTQVGTQQR
ncbi:MAG: Gfo/Idh/MocA family oxidoreductase, partial [Pirellulales bacterium]|nr:Gfo/Idh/MocA family oxidoreductase [Pirellulales bacterium]